MKYLIRFEDDLAPDPSVVGHKFASLARAKHSGLAVPSAVAIRVEANEFYRRKKFWPKDLQREIKDVVRKSAFPKAFRYGPHPPRRTSREKALPANTRPIWIYGMTLI